MGANIKTASAGDTHIRIHGYMVLASVVAVLHRASGNTGMTVDTFFLVNFNDDRECFLHVQVYQGSNVHEKLLQCPGWKLIKNESSSERWKKILNISNSYLSLAINLYKDESISGI